MRCPQRRENYQCGCIQLYYALSEVSVVIPCPEVGEVIVDQEESDLEDVQFAPPSAMVTQRAS